MARLSARAATRVEESVGSAGAETGECEPHAGMAAHRDCQVKDGATVWYDWRMNPSHAHYAGHHAGRTFRKHIYADTACQGSQENYFKRCNYAKDEPASD